MEDMTGRSTRGYVFFLFRKKERTKEKSIRSFFRGIADIRYRGYDILYERGGACMLL